MKQKGTKFIEYVWLVVCIIASITLIYSIILHGFNVKNVLSFSIISAISFLMYSFRRWQRINSKNKYE